ncbi:MAG: hypothetical protein AAGI51_11155 [Pseudomonadota bacterium]
MFDGAVVDATVASPGNNAIGLTNAPKRVGDNVLPVGEEGAVRTLDHGVNAAV